MDQNDGGPVIAALVDAIKANRGGIADAIFEAVWTHELKGLSVVGSQTPVIARGVLQKPRVEVVDPDA